MKKQALFTMVVTLLLFTGCQQVSNLTKVKMPYSQQITVPKMAAIVSTPYPISTPPMTTNTSTTLGNLGYALNMIEKISLSKFDLVLNSPADGDLNFFNTIKIYIQADGLAKTLIAETTVPVSTMSSPKLTKISMTCTDVNLKDYFLKNQVTLTTEVTTDQLTSADYKIDANSEFTIDVNVFGL